MKESKRILVNSVIPGVTGYNLKDTIDLSYSEAHASPIDRFINNGIEINKLFTNADPPRILGNLIILGYVSAVESYFRDLIRRIILIDEPSRKTCEKKQISFGSVRLNEMHMLPEALFDDKSLAGKKDVLNSLNNFLGLNLQENSLPPTLSDTLNQFDEICELRHCIVHRFGKFGSKNAITLGLSEYTNHIEKPISCSFSTLQKIITICHNTVRILNNHLFNIILERLISYEKSRSEPIWLWDYLEDKDLFDKYFDIFLSEEEPPTANFSAQDAYLKYKDNCSH